MLKNAVHAGQWMTVIDNHPWLQLSTVTLALTNAFCTCALQQAENEIGRLPAVTCVNARVMREA